MLFFYRDVRRVCHGDVAHGVHAVQLFQGRRDVKLRVAVHVLHCCMPQRL